jgi:hypothetical protein
MLADQRSRLRPVKLRLANDMRTAGDRRHRRRVTESAAKRHGAKQHGIGRVESDAARDIDRMPSDRLLIMQNQFWSAGRTRCRESKARRFRRCRVTPRFPGRTLKRQHRHVSKLGHAYWGAYRKHAP